MKQIAVVYFSHTGVTTQLADAIISGAKEIPNTTALSHQIAGEEIINGRFRNEVLFKNLANSDAIIFGSPTYMGSAAAQFKAFADASSETWSEQLWAGKLAAGFTCGSGANGEQSFTLQYFHTLASQQGMLWVSVDSAYGFNDHGVNRMGCSTGVVAHSPDGKAHKEDLATAQFLGKRVASLAQQFQMNPLRLKSA